MGGLCPGNERSHDGRLTHNCAPFSHVSCRVSNGNSASFGGNGCFEGETGATGRVKKDQTKALGRCVAYVGHIPHRLPLLTDVRCHFCSVHPRIKSSCNSFQLHFQVGNTARYRIQDDKVQSNLGGQDSRVSDQDEMLGGACGGLEHRPYVDNESSNHGELHNVREECNKHRA